MSKTIEEIAEIVNRCSYPGFELLVKTSRNGMIYLQVYCPDGVCSVTGEPMPWKGRKWFISEHSCRNEIVGTAFKAVMGAMEHEIRENFKYKDVPIFDPHLDPDLLVELRNRPNALNVREGQ